MARSRPALSHDVLAARMQEEACRYADVLRDAKVKIIETLLEHGADVQARSVDVRGDCMRCIAAVLRLRLTCT